MGEQDLVIQIISDISELNCNFFINGRNMSTTSNAISEAMEYWRKQKIALSTVVLDNSYPPNIDLSNKISGAKITSINVIEITPV